MSCILHEIKEIIRFIHEKNIECCRIFFGFCPAFVVLNNLDVFRQPLKSYHQLSLMRFTEHKGSPVPVWLMLSKTQVCFHLLPGMGVTTVTAARILKGQLAGKSGEETSLVMDTFPHLALSKVGAL